MPSLGDRLVHPEELVDIPDDQLDSFTAAGWRSPGEPIVWPPAPREQDTPPVDQSAGGSTEVAQTPPPPPVDDPPPADQTPPAGEPPTEPPSTPATTTKRK